MTHYCVLFQTQGTSGSANEMLRDTRTHSKAFLLLESGEFLGEQLLGCIGSSKGYSGVSLSNMLQFVSMDFAEAMKEIRRNNDTTITGNQFFVFKQAESSASVVGVELTSRCTSR